MKSITIQVSDETMKHVESLVAAGEYASAEEYFAVLIERDRQDDDMPQWMEDELARRLEAMDRGEGGEEEVTPEYWDRMRKALSERLRRARGEVA